MLSGNTRDVTKILKYIQFFMVLNWSRGFRVTSSIVSTRRRSIDARNRDWIALRPESRRARRQDLNVNTFDRAICGSVHLDRRPSVPPANRGERAEGKAKTQVHRGNAAAQPAASGRDNGRAAGFGQ